MRLSGSRSSVDHIRMYVDATPYSIGNPVTKNAIRSVPLTARLELIPDAEARSRGECGPDCPIGSGPL